MNSQTITNWIQVSTMIAVLAGLGLVVWELRQVREIAIAQQASDGFAIYSQRIQAMMGERPARAVAKACDEPKSLTTEDMVVLDFYYTEVLNNMRQLRNLQQASDDLALLDWKQFTENFYRIFRTDYGRWWWSMSGWLEPEILDAGDRFIDENEVISCSEHYDQYRRLHD